MLKVESLRVAAEGKEILKGLDLEVGAGEVHAIMGPNGSGKSTLAHVLSGRPGYEIVAGSVWFCGKDLLALEPHERAGEGLFLGFQYPVEIPGLNNAYFLRAALNAVRAYRGEEELDAMDFLKLSQEKMRALGIRKEYSQRAVNEGFSGGEKKRNEVFQMAVLQPRLAVLDEIDSGLDIDALKVVAEGINGLRDAARSILLVTHYQRLLDYVPPDRVHVLADGKVVRSGSSDLAAELEQEGYGWLADEPHTTQAPA